MLLSEVSVQEDLIARGRHYCYIPGELLSDFVVSAILVNGFGVPGFFLRVRFESCLHC